MKAPGFGDNRKATLQDIAVITGGQVHNPSSPLTLPLPLPLCTPCPSKHAPTPLRLTFPHHLSPYSPPSSSRTVYNQVISEELGLTLENVTEEHLGTCAKIKVHTPHTHSASEPSFF